MPTVVLAIVDDAAAASALALRLPLKTPVATIEVNEQELRTYPFESIVELTLRPIATAVVRAWRHGRA